MINIRRGTFETNSSSTHSICITKEDSNLTTEELLDKYDLDIDNCLVMYNSYRLKLKTLNINE